MPVWLVGLLLAMCGYLGFQSWSGLAKGEFLDLNRYVSVVRKSDGATRFWTAWTILTAIFLFMALFTIGGVFAMGVRV